MSRNFLTSFFLFYLLLAFPSFIETTQANEYKAQKGRGSRLRMVEPDIHSPELYADELKMKFSLVDLPGAKDTGSYFEVVYQLYFIPEASYWGMVKKAGLSGQPVTGPADYPDKILLADGKFKIDRLATPKDRIHIRNEIPFKSKIPDKERTKFANLMTSYTVKIYDARLKMLFYLTSYFISGVFEDDPDKPERATSRLILYTNFFVSAKGDLYRSNWKRTIDDANWSAK